MAFILAASSFLALAPAVSNEASAPIRIDIDFPQPGAIVQNDVDLAPVRGHVQAGSDAPNTFDVFLALDVSHSTRYPSGIDIDEDGEVGFNPALELVVPGTYPEEMVSTDPDDVILAAEVRAARLLIEALDSGQTRVGVIVFSGDVEPKTGKRRRFDQQDARLLVPLTGDFKAVERALDDIMKTGPNGATNFSAAIKLSVRELSGFSGAKSRPRAGAKKLLLFLTDGVPTFPIGSGRSSDPGDTEAAINAARLARKAGVTINSFALGRHALAAPIAASEMARITSGVYTPVRNPGQIVSFLQGVSFANVEDVVIR
ncbi:MAG: vWA domain-containing protein, partial [Myxococcota bacterium]